MGGHPVLAGTFGPRTTCPGGQLFPRTTCPGGHLVWGTPGPGGAPGPGDIWSGKHLVWGKRVLRHRFEMHSLRIGLALSDKLNAQNHSAMV